MTVTDHHWIQIKKISYATVRNLPHAASPSPATDHSMASRTAETWQLTAQAEVMILSDEMLSIAGQLVTAQLSRLPTPHLPRAHRRIGLCLRSMKVLEALYRQVRQPPEGWNPAEFARLLEETVRAGRRPDVQPRLVANSALYTAQWQADQIYLRQNKCGDWFLGMIFDVQHVPGRRHCSPDTGRSGPRSEPLTVACTGAGEFQTFPLSSLEHLRDVTRCGLTPEAQDLLAQMAYASGRADTRSRSLGTSTSGQAGYMPRIST